MAAAGSGSTAASASQASTASGAGPRHSTSLAIESDNSELLGSLGGGSGASSSVTSSLTSAFQSLISALTGGTSSSSGATPSTTSATSAESAQSIISSFVDSQIAGLSGARARLPRAVRVTHSAASSIPSPEGHSHTVARDDALPRSGRDDRAHSRDQLTLRVVAFVRTCPPADMLSGRPRRFQQDPKLTTHAPYPIGTPGIPWGRAEVATWLSRQTVKRSYEADVLRVIDTLRSRYDVVQYGCLDYPPHSYPLFAIKSSRLARFASLCIGDGRSTWLRNERRARRVAVYRPARRAYEGRINLVVAPCVSPWAYEVIHRWNIQRDRPEPLVSRR